MRVKAFLAARSHLLLKFIRYSVMALVAVLIIEFSIWRRQNEDELWWIAISALAPYFWFLARRYWKKSDYWLVNKIATFLWNTFLVKLWAAFLTFAGLLLASAAGAWVVYSAPQTPTGSASIGIEQFRNGGAGTAARKDELLSATGWVSGNSGQTNAHYVEGFSVPYRARMQAVPTNRGDIVVFLGYDTKHAGHVAFDFLTHYHCLEPHGVFGHNAETVTPTDGTGVGHLTPTTQAIPAPNFASNGATWEVTPYHAWNDCANGPVFTMWGGTIRDVAYFEEGSYADTVDEYETQIMVQFTPTNSEVVLAWGAHIARRSNWGFFDYPRNTEPRPAGGINSSPYHMRLNDWRYGTISGGNCQNADVCTAPGVGNSVASVGSQDRSLSAEAVLTATPNQ